MVHVYISMWLCVYKYICILCIHIIESRDVHIVYQGAAKNFQESHLWCCRRRTGWPRQLPQLRWLDLSMFLGLKTTEDLGENSGFWREGKKSHLQIRHFLVFHFWLWNLVPSCFASISWVWPHYQCNHNLPLVLSFENPIPTEVVNWKTPQNLPNS